MDSARIESTQNPRVKQARKLRERKARDAQGLTLVDGFRELQRAVDAGHVPQQLFLLDKPLSSDEQQLLETCRQENTEVLTVNETVFGKLSFGQRSDGWVATLPAPQHSLDAIQLNDNSCVAVVQQVEKPGNLGAILRSADGANLAAVIVADEATDLFNPNVIRASLGAVFTVPTCTASTGDALRWLADHDFHVFTTRVDAQLPYYQADLTGKAAIVLGSESRGLTDQWQGRDVTALSLPMHGVLDSLNVSSTAAVLFYEALRQRSLQELGKLE